MNKKTLAWAACLVFSLVSGMPAAQAQSTYAPPPASYTQEQLDQMLAPVALYPDSLLAQVLMASTYPLEVVQAQRFVEARPGLQGDGLARSVAPMPWDPSVKALVQFPSVLAMMNDRLDWMQQLGQAFLSQQAAVMDTVQNLRERAQIAGSLRTSPQQRVLVHDDVIVIEPVDPQVVYVPYYNPVVVYGSWWWPANPPVYWAPPPRYRPPQYNPGVTVGITFSSGIGVMRAVFGDARPDWRQRQMMVTQTRITNVTNNVTTNNVTVNRNVTVNQRPMVWHHDSRYDGTRYQQQQRPNAQPSNAARPQQGQAVAQLPTQPPHPERPAAMSPAANPQQRVIQDDQARQRQVREQQASQAREIQAQQQQRERQVQEQQRQREQQANNQQRQREQQAQQQQQRQQQIHEQQAREQQRQAQQVRQQQEQAHREQQARPQPQPREERPQEHRRDERRDDRRDDKS